MSTSTSSQQPDELLPPVALDWATALLVVATGMLEADHEKRAGDFGPYSWGVFWDCLVSQLHFLALNELSRVCKALLVSVSPGVRWSHLHLRSVQCQQWMGPS